MKELKISEGPITLLLVCGFHLLIWSSHAIEICKMLWYRISGTPYEKLNDKFHPVYRKNDEIL